MPGAAVVVGAAFVLQELRLEELATMRADDDGMGQLHFAHPFDRYIAVLARSARDTKAWLTIHFLEGWTPDEHRFWVVSGERP